MSTELTLDVYGYKVLIKSDLYNCDHLKAAIDFDHFRLNKSQLNYNLIISLQHLKNYQTSGLYIGKTKMCRVRQKSFNCRELEYIHNLQTLAIVNDDTSEKTRQLTINAINLDVIDDILYFFINSSVGEYLDYNGLMRLHALSYTLDGHANLIHGAPGFGKSTLAIELIKNADTKIFSDEISVFDLSKNLLQPYPMRIACSEMMSSELETQNVKFTYFFNKKYLTNIEKNKIASPAALQNIYLLINTNSSGLCKAKASLFQKVRLSYEIIFGTGLIQMWEYFLRLNNPHIFCRILFNRIKLVFRIWNVQFYTVNRRFSLKEKLNSLFET